MGVISVIIAIPTAIIGIPPVQEHLFDRGPRIELNLASEIAVLDIRRPMQGLSIILYGKDLNASEESLVASRVIIKNTGKSGIRSNDVSSADPLGFFISGGQLLQIAQFVGSTPHLQKYAKPIRYRNSVLLNTEIIIDHGDSLQFDLLIKKPRKSTIFYYPLGKISNVKKINVLDFRKVGIQRGFIEESFYGSFAIQILRLFVYFIAAILIISGFTFTYETISKFLKKREIGRRKKIVDSFFEAKFGIEITTTDVVAAVIYMNLGAHFLAWHLDNLKKMLSLDEIKNTNRYFSERFDEEISPTFDSVNSYLSSRYIKSFPYYLNRVENFFELVSIDKKTVQKKYVGSLESLNHFQHIRDPKGKLSPKINNLEEFFNIN